MYTFKPMSLIKRSMLLAALIPVSNVLLPDAFPLIANDEVQSEGNNNGTIINFNLLKELADQAVNALDLTNIGSLDHCYWDMGECANCDANKIKKYLEEIITLVHDNQLASAGKILDKTVIIAERLLEKAAQRVSDCRSTDKYAPRRLKAVLLALYKMYFVLSKAHKMESRDGVVQDAKQA